MPLEPTHYLMAKTHTKKLEMCVNPSLLDMILISNQLMKINNFCRDLDLLTDSHIHIHTHGVYT